MLPQPTVLDRPLTKPLPVAEVYYPESDGEPMAETDVHRDLMSEILITPLKTRYQKAGNVYVTGNIWLYYEEGDPTAVISPDVFVVFGLPNRRRRVYKMWVEGKGPDVVFELTSTSTRRRDLGEKRQLYEDLGVKEYFLFDPLGEYLSPPLRGFVLRDGFFSNLELVKRPDGEYQLFSELLGLEIHTANGLLRLYDPIEKRYLLYATEENAARQEAERQARSAEKQARNAERQARNAEERLMAEREARLALEKQLAEMAAELARLRG